MDHAIVRATRELLGEVGYAQLTTDAVAARAGVGKAAIYRRYASRAEMVFAAVVHDLDLPSPPDAGSLRADLAAVARDVVDCLGGPAVLAALPGLLADVLHDPGMAERFQAGLVARERAILAELVDRAVARGELRRAPDLDLLHALLLGPVFARLFLLRQPLDTFADDLAAAVAAALTA